MASIKSLFNKQDLQTVSNVNEVTIFNAVTDEAVNGLMQESINLSFSPKYYNVKEVSETVGNIIEKIDSLQVIPTNMVSTAQIYDGGDYLDLNIKLRITDTTGDGSPMKAATLFGQWASPWDHKLRAWDTTQIYVEDKINNSLGNSRLTGESPHAIRESQQKGSTRKRSELGNNSSPNQKGTTVDKWGATTWDKKLGDAASHITDGNAGEAFTEFLSLLTDVKLSVAIGDWFFARGNMILKSVNQSFSMEQGPAGPLFVDFDIGLESITVLTKRNILELFPLVQKSGDNDIIARSYAQLSVSGERFTGIKQVADNTPIGDINSEAAKAALENQKKKTGVDSQVTAVRNLAGL
jgi:hypothetical protein